MEINFNLTEEDYIHFNLYHIKNSKSAIRSLNVQRFLTPVFFILLSYILSLAGDTPFIELFIAFFITSILWILFYPKYFYSSITRRIKKMFREGKNGDLLGKHVLSMTDEGLVESRSNGQTKLNWSGIISLKEDKQYFYLYNSSVSALILPKRELANEEEVRNFLNSKVADHS
jgi:small-conductance mechanosensitive channel